jgi:hypothetical protein
MIQLKINYYYYYYYYYYYTYTCTKCVCIAEMSKTMNLMLCSEVVHAQTASCIGS